MECIEIWKPVPGYEGFYEASSLGRVRSVERIVINRGTPRRRKSVVLRGARIKMRGKLMYHRVTLSKDGVNDNRSVHVIICETFHGPRPQMAVVRHIDGDGFNNTPGNVCWGTSKENIADQFRLGERSVGEGSPHAKLKASQVIAIKQLIREGVSKAEIGRKFNTSDTNIFSIAQGRTWAHLEEVTS